MGRLRVGLAKVDLTPPLPVLLEGYPHRDPAINVHDPIYARAIVLDDGQTKACHICLDLCGVARDQITWIREAIAGQTGMSAENITVSVTHNHNAPHIFGGYGLYNLRRRIGPTPFNEEYASIVNRLAASAAIMAHTRLTEARIGAGRGHLDGISGNRRIYVNGEMRMYGIKGNYHSYAPEAHPDYAPHPIDPEVGVVRFDTLAGEPFGVLFNFTAHALAAGPATEVSGDYPAAACRTIEQWAPGVVPLFVQGTCGNVHPRLNGRARSFAEADRKGRLLAHEVMKTFAAVETTDQVELGVFRREVDLPYRSPRPDLDELQGKVEHWRVQVGLTAPESEEFHQAAIMYINAIRDASQWRQVADAGRTGERSLVQVMTLNDLALVFIPGESFVEMGLEIKEHSPFEQTIVSAYAHGVRHYIPIRKAYGEGGYESTYGTVFAPEASENIVSTALELLREGRQPGCRK